MVEAVVVLGLGRRGREMSMLISCWARGRRWRGGWLGVR